MNVLLTTDYFPPHMGGGVEVAVYRLAIELNRLGHKVSVVTLNTRHVKNFETVQRVQVYRATQSSSPDHWACKAQYHLKP